MSLTNLLMTPKGFVFETYCVRFTGFSILNHIFARQQGFKPRPALVLRVKGRKSGQWRQVALPYFQVGDELMIIGSKGGGPEDPHWAKNLRASLEGEIYLNRKKHRVTARFAEGEEYDRLWKMASSEVPTYKGYEELSKGIRKIPVMLLKPSV